MDTRIGRGEKPRFRTAARSLGPMNAEMAGDLIAASADVALVLSADGTIADAAFGNQELLAHGFDSWLGRSWFDVTTSESRPKIEELLKARANDEGLRWRQVNHPSESGPEVPIRYATFALPEEGKFLAIGRDMLAVSAVQQRLVEAQLAMEREYAKLRRAETRYRLLFQIASDAMLIAEAQSLRVIEANPAAAELLGRDERRLVGGSLAAAFAPSTRQALQDTVSLLRESGQAQGASLQANDSKLDVTARITGFRQDGVNYLLIRLSSLDPVAHERLGKGARSVLDAVRKSPEALVVTDPSGRILHANPAFLDLTQVPRLDAVLGEPVGRWLGRTGVDLNVLMANLKEHGAVRLFASELRDEFGSSTPIELSAVSVPEGDPPCIGFMIRSVEGRLPASQPGVAGLPRSVEHLSKLVGRVPLKDLVQESTDIIERLCIEAALELTGDNRASAAEMLGLSRQSLYVKLRRHNIGNLNSE